MIKIEDIFKCDIGNWEVYKELLEKDNFVPVVGAGLSMDMGVVGWNELIISLAEYVFDYGKTADKTDDELEEELDFESKSLIKNSLDKLKELDKKDIEKPQQKAKHIKERIDFIKKFVLDSKKSGEKEVDLRYIFFKKLLNRGTFFSTYEAAELLQIVNDDDRHLMKCLYRIINNNKQEEGWKIEKDKAVYWLAEVLRILRESKKERDLDNIADCFTTNYDDILEKACLKESVPEVKIEHLHGYFDAQKEPHDICLSLSDLLSEYQDRLNDREARINSNSGIGLMESGNTDVPFLFLGTSFSESHIGQLARLRPSYGIVPLPGKNNEMDFLRDKMKKFMIGKDTTFFYPVEKGNHNALVILIHQLARDLSNGFWNNWFFMKHFPKQLDSLTNAEIEKVNEAISWLKDSESHILSIKKGKTLEFNIAEEEGELKYNNSGILFFICEKLKEEFKRPEWSEYCEIEETFKKWYQEDLEPLGNTIYIYRKEEESEDHWMKFKRQIKDWYSEKGRERWEYKIVRFILSYDERKEVQNGFTACSIEKIRDKLVGNRGHDIELSPLYEDAIWDKIMDIMSIAIKFQDIKKDDEEWRDVNLSSQDSFVEEWKNFSDISLLEALYSYRYSLSEGFITDKFDGRPSFVGNSLKGNDDKVNKKENVKELTKKR